MDLPIRVNDGAPTAFGGAGVAPSIAPSIALCLRRGHQRLGSSLELPGIGSLCSAMSGPDADAPAPPILPIV